MLAPEVRGLREGGGGFRHFHVPGASATFVNLSGSQLDPISSSERETYIHGLRLTSITTNPGLPSFAGTFVHAREMWSARRTSGLKLGRRSRETPARTSGKECVNDAYIDAI